MSSIIRKKCVITGEKLNKIIDLGNFSLANDLQKKRKLSKTFNLSLTYSSKSKIVQINNIVDPKKLFKNYLWVTGTSKKINEYKNNFFNICNDYIKNSKKPKVLEIASNDGTFLEIFKQNNCEVLGVDPAKNLLKISNKKNINTLTEFYNFSLSKKINKKFGQFDLIYARNVIAHVKDINSFVKSINLNLKNEGIGCFEFHYLGEILKGLQYDSIYHEHIYYFSLSSISVLLKKFNLYVFDCKRSPISGGSLIVFFSKDLRKKSKDYLKTVKFEKINKINNISSFNHFASRCVNHKNYFHNIILKKIKNKKIVAYGASARGSTLLNFLDINNKIIKKIIDINILKQNLYIPNLNLKIVSPKYINEYKPEYIFLLSWNFKKEILIFLKKTIKNKCKVIIPLPNNFKIINIH